jgi:hypothetical protein
VLGDVIRAGRFRGCERKIQSQGIGSSYMRREPGGECARCGSRLRFGKRAKLMNSLLAISSLPSTGCERGEKHAVCL